MTVFWLVRLIILKIPSCIYSMKLLTQDILDSGALCLQKDSLREHGWTWSVEVDLSVSPVFHCR